MKHKINLKGNQINSKGTQEIVFSSVKYKNTLEMQAQGRGRWGRGNRRVLPSNRLDVLLDGVAFSQQD